MNRVTFTVYDRRTGAPLIHVTRDTRLAALAEAFRIAKGDENFNIKERV